MTVLAFPHVDDTDQDTVPSVYVTTLAHITYRQLDHWTRAGYLTACPRIHEHSGIPREYPRTEAVVARLMRHLVDAGINPQMASKYARELLEHGTTRIAGITVHLPEQL